MRTLSAPLVSNGYTLDTTPARLGWLTPSDPAAPMPQLVEQYQSQGYLWLKGILNRDDVLDFRERYFAAMAETGLLQPDSAPRDGLYSGGDEDREAVHRIIGEVVRWAAYEAFCLSAPIIRFYEEFLGGTVYLHKRKLIRHTKPGEKNCTGGHYDLVYLRAGTDRLCTSWIPIGDIPAEMGGLIYLRGSDGVGRTMEADFSCKNAELSPEERISAFNRNMNESGWISTNVVALADRFDSAWLMADYEAGDMVVHSPYMIHAATTNMDEQGRLRLSTDIRYQRVADAIDPRWANNWTPDDGV